MFKKYLHVERYGNDEVQGIEFGTCYIFPKLDGSNGSVWIENGIVHAGSRTRILSEKSDNQGFYSYIKSHDNINIFLNHYPHLRLYGEWLVPHSLTTYNKEAWNKFYIFDVYNDKKESFLSYTDYKHLLDKYDLDYIPAICSIKNSTYDSLLSELNKNVFLIIEGKGIGEGIVIKNYEYKNKFGSLCFAKIVANSFQEKMLKNMPLNEKAGKQLIEQKMVDIYVDDHLVNKVFSKIVNECEGWSSKYIPRLLQSVYYDLVKEELWDFIKKENNPTINFKTLNTLTILKIKQLKSELF